ncbi:hypothetical protein [Haloferax sp. Atlit-4N]|uniref:hypothetical protein n=1 Tax=Haloferax sp. Atlit-4N TaxID=2077206 RepID=UPI0011C07F39|nr:hypothetical protein [Haloferax sp. Atlit-4N]
MSSDPFLMRAFQPVIALILLIFGVLLFFVILVVYFVKIAYLVVVSLNNMPHNSENFQDVSTGDVLYEPSTETELDKSRTVIVEITDEAGGPVIGLPVKIETSKNTIFGKTDGTGTISFEIHKDVSKLKFVVGDGWILRSKSIPLDEIESDPIEGEFVYPSLVTGIKHAFDQNVLSKLPKNIN